MVSKGNGGPNAIQRCCIYTFTVTRKTLESVKHSLTLERVIRNHGILNVYKEQLHTYGLQSFQGIENGNMGLEWVHALLY